MNMFPSGWSGFGRDLLHQKEYLSKRFVIWSVLSMMTLCVFAVAQGRELRGYDHGDDDDDGGWWWPWGYGGDDD